MSIDTALALVGIALTLFFGFAGVRWVINKRKMSQKTSNGSTAIQSGRDTTINGGN